MRLFTAWLLLGLFLSSGCTVAPGNGSDPETVTLSFDFNEGQQGWESGLTDYGLAQLPTLMSVAEIRDLPDELNDPGQGFYLQSNNTPDDLFTFLKRRVSAADGLVANQEYEVSYTVVFASNAPTGCAGVGGPPGESVVLKSGASEMEPEPTLIDGEYVAINVDKGDQLEGGAAASVVGPIANGIDCETITDLSDVPYVTLTRQHTHDTTVTTSDTGALWLLVGIESGFEAITGVYYQRIEVTLEPVQP